MSFFRIRQWAFTLFLCVAGCVAEIDSTRANVNVEVISVKENVSFICYLNTSGTKLWSSAIGGTPWKSTNTRFKIINDSRTNISNLTITSVEKQDADVYVCKVSTNSVAFKVLLVPVVFTHSSTNNSSSNSENLRDRHLFQIICSSSKTGIPNPNYAKNTPYQTVATSCLWSDCVLMIKNYSRISYGINATNSIDCIAQKISVYYDTVSQEVSISREYHTQQYEDSANSLTFTYVAVVCIAGSTTVLLVVIVTISLLNRKQVTGNSAHGLNTFNQPDLLQNNEPLDGDGCLYATIQPRDLRVANLAATQEMNPVYSNVNVQTDLSTIEIGSEETVSIVTKYAELAPSTGLSYSKTKFKKKKEADYAEIDHTMTNQ